MSGIATLQYTPLDLYAKEALWAGRFDQLEVWRSRMSGQGPYEPLFDDAPSPARVPPGALGDESGARGKTVSLTGLYLLLRLAETTDVLVTFATPGVMTMADAAAVIGVTVPSLLRSFVLSDGSLVIETITTGPEVTLRVVSGGAAPLLGLATEEPDSVGFGRGSRLDLVSGQSRYPFADLNGSSSYFYRVRFFNSTTHETSEFGPSFQAPPIGGLSEGALIKGTLDLVNAKGVPVAGVTVLIHMRFDGRSIEGKVLAGSTLQEKTDRMGHVEFMLPRGTTVTVSVAGTDLSRLVAVPMEPTLDAFDLVDPSYGKDDLFVVQRPDLSYAARRSM